MNPGFVLIKCHRKLDNLAVALINILFIVFLSRGQAIWLSHLLKDTLRLVWTWASPRSQRSSHENCLIKKTRYVRIFYFEGRWEIRIQCSAEKGSFRNARAVETAQRGSCQQPARNSPVMRAMTHTCPCCSSPSDVGAILVVWDVSGERTWQSSPLLHNLAVPAHRGTVHPGQGAAAGGTGYKILLQLMFPFSLHFPQSSAPLE